ncbi:DNA cytosine methyltransferase [Rugamonas sp. DEMB1]|uniref:DNA cytosine methyltransferase n=1 Tax=Rugamonas sp. DEMB1 TaxID=3039386 RepID=UPI002449CCD0|nr:DNA cytosine methyltransferase [Rugamonas sp. DEMB1]WGG48960.1 DNA cytosine methyltransferase [Rugamonas sp. DEMB1]
MKRDNFTLPLDLGNELLIDNFAGGGGASEGIEQAFGRPVDVAINHNGEALAMHAANHPSTAHCQEDVYAVHPGFITGNRPIGLAWFSPDCKHHSKAKGGKPREKKIRGLAWVTLKWGAFQWPRCIALENVEEFRDWGPLDDAGQPIASEKGRTFDAFLDALSTGLDRNHPDVPEIYAALGADFPMERLFRGLGYKVEHRILRACDFGTPTIRKRLFVFARRDGLAIHWPKPTHGNPALPSFATSGLKPWRTAADCIDWSIPCTSIFGRKKELADKTLARIAKGVMKYIVNADEPFVVPGDAVPFLTEHANGSTQRNFAADEPLRTQCAEIKGGHFALVSAMLAKHYGGVVGTAVTVPFGAVTTTDHHSVVTSTLVSLRNNQAGKSILEPVPTIIGGGTHIGEVRAFLIKYYSEGGQDQALTDPMHTIPTKDRIGLVAIRGEDYAIVDIGMRMLTPRELARAQGFPESYILELVHNGKRLSKAAQVRMIGNSVCPPLARALIEANFKHEQQFARAA